MVLYEQVRPKTWAELVGNDKVKALVQSLKARDALWGQSFWITGKSGTGKTCISYLLAREIADDIAIQETHAESLTPAKLEELTGKWCMSSLFGLGGHVLIISEAQGLRKDTVRALLVFMEKMARFQIASGRAMIIFTTTREGEKNLFDEEINAHPLLSRCIEIKAQFQGINPIFAAHCKAIAEKVGLDGKPLAAYQLLAESCKGNMREMLEKIEAGVML